MGGKPCHFYSLHRMLMISMAAPYLQKKIGKIGMTVLEHISGLILILMAMQMMLSAFYEFSLNFS